MELVERDAALGDELDRLGVLVVLAHRSGLEPDHPLRGVLGRVPASAAVHLDLAPLSPEAVARLADVPDPRGLWRRTGGNPFLVSALVRHGAGGVPPTVQDAVLGELADLEPEERGLVELVAVVPTHVESVVLDACRPGWEAHGTRPELRGLLELDAQALRFRHDIARQAVLESLPVRTGRRCSSTSGWSPTPTPCRWRSVARDLSAQVGNRSGQARGAGAVGPHRRPPRVGDPRQAGGGLPTRSGGAGRRARDPPGRVTSSADRGACRGVR